MKPLHKISVILIRLIGVFTAFVLIAFALAHLFLPPENGTSITVFDIFSGIFYLVIGLCLLVPFSLVIKKHGLVVKFARVFFYLGILFALMSPFFSPISFGFILAIGIFSNIWLLYQKIEKLPAVQSPE